MSGINTARVLIGGLIGGLVINIGETLLNAVVLANEMEAISARFNLPPMGGGTIALFVVLCFLLGVLAVWVYAAIRPRFGPGPMTAIRAGAVVWFAAYLFPGVVNAAMGFFPAGLTAVALAWGLVEVLAGAVAGAYFYREHGQASRPARV